MNKEQQRASKHPSQYPCSRDDSDGGGLEGVELAERPGVLLEVHVVARALDDLHRCVELERRPVEHPTVLRRDLVVVHCREGSARTRQF